MENLHFWEPMGYNMLYGWNYSLPPATKWLTADKWVKPMKKIFPVLLALVMVLLFAGEALATATIGATIVSINPSGSSLTVELKSGTRKEAVLVKHFKAYILNQPARLNAFKPGQYVVLKICNPLNDSPWQVEVLMDTYSARQFTQYRTVTPIHPPTASGGFATSGGSSSPGLPPVTGVYPNAISNQWPNNNQLPQGLTWNPNNSGTMKAQPSPWGSPAMGDVVSGNPGTGNPPMVSDGGVVNYDTGPAVTATSEDSKGSVIPNLGIKPDQGNWASKPTENLPTRRVMDIMGRIRQYDAGYSTLYVEDFNKPVIYTVLFSPNSKILDFMTNETVAGEHLKVGLVVKVLGTGGDDNVIRASQIRVQR